MAQHAIDLTMKPTFKNANEKVDYRALLEHNSNRKLNISKPPSHSKIFCKVFLMGVVSLRGNLVHKRYYGKT